MHRLPLPGYERDRHVMFSHELEEQAVKVVRAVGQVASGDACGELTRFENLRSRHADRGDATTSESAVSPGEIAT